MRHYSGRVTKLQPAMPDAVASTTYRLFVALPIPGPVKAEIERVQVELRRALPDHSARWTKREQFHLTLRFLGNVRAQRVPELVNAARAACRNFPPLKLRAERVGCFPDLRFPRVVWVWVHDETNRLLTFQKAVERATADFAETSAEEDFTGHVTIARTKNIKRPQAEILAKLAQGMAESFFGEWIADGIEIMRSELAPAGARHSCLAAISLAGQAT
jgi:RNA 2',3'-cyclic 3'-phosphodiesterase